MYRNSFKKGLLTIFYSAGINPLRNWDVHRKDGYIKRIYEKENGMLVMEMRALNTTLHYISCPSLPRKNLGISMPIINLLLRNLNACFSFEIRVMDDSNQARRFRCANYIRCSTINLFDTVIPLAICCDWVLIYFNLAEFTRRCYGTEYLETQRIQVNGNVHLRRIFFSDKVVEYNKLPKDYQLSVLLKDAPPPPSTPSGRPPSPASAKARSIRARRTQHIARSERTSNISEFEVPTTALDDAPPPPPAPKGSLTSLNKVGSAMSTTLLRKSYDEFPTTSGVGRETNGLSPIVQTLEEQAIESDLEGSQLDL